MNIFPLFFAAAKIGIGRGPFYFAATKIRIGRGPLLRLVGCGRDRRHSGGFLLRIMPPSWHPVPACTPRLRCRRTILSCSSDEGNGILQAKLFSFAATKLESDAEVVVAEPQLSCSDSQIDPLKSRITAAFGLFLGEILQ